MIISPLHIELYHRPNSHLSPLPIHLMGWVEGNLITLYQAADVKDAKQLLREKGYVPALSGSFRLWTKDHLTLCTHSPRATIITPFYCTHCRTEHDYRLNSHPSRCPEIPFSKLPKQG